MENEIREEIKKAEEELKTEVDRITRSVETNTRNLLVQEEQVFYSVIKCSICLSEKEIKDYSQIQASVNKWFLSADMLNKVLGFAPDFKKIEELTLKMGKTSNMIERDKIAKEIMFLKNNFAALPFVCPICASKLQEEFKKVFDKMMVDQYQKEANKGLNEGEILTTNLFSNQKEVTAEEKRMLTATTTSDGVK